jgi:hypothetical protein
MFPEEDVTRPHFGLQQFAGCVEAAEGEACFMHAMEADRAAASRAKAPLHIVR